MIGIVQLDPVERRTPPSVLRQSLEEQDEDERASEQDAQDQSSTDEVRDGHEQAAVMAGRSTPKSSKIFSNFGMMKIMMKTTMATAT